MELFNDPLLLARLQFAVTALFHILWPVLSIGLSLWLLTLEILWLKTGDLVYYRHARFWSRLFLLNFVVGVVSGLPLQFEFGTNWAPFATASGDFFGSVLGFEAAMAFMLEAGFLGIMVFGWDRVRPGIHLIATFMVAFGASLSAFWIMTANAWMHTPAGGRMVDGVFVIESFRAAIFNANMPWAVSHMWVACLQTSLFVIGGISAWYILRDRHSAFFLRSLRLAVAGAVVVAPLQIFIGHGSGTELFKHQPVKAAALEAHWETNPPGQGAGWSVLAWPDREAQTNRWSLTIPNLLSLLATQDPQGKVAGLREVPVADQPPALPLLYYCFRLMVLIGFALLALALWSLWAWWRGHLAEPRVRRHPRLLRAWVAALPLGYLAVECGWIVREVGRQPWVIHGWLRTEDAVSALPAATVGGSLAAYLAIYLGLLIAFLIFAARLLRRGPDLSVTPAPRQSR